MSDRPRRVTRNNNQNDDITETETETQQEELDRKYAKVLYYQEYRKMMKANEQPKQEDDVISLIINN